MTDISKLKPGDALTYEQAMALPDGAVVSAVWGDDAQRTCYTAGGKHSRKFGGATLARKGYWNADQWHSVRLESMPGLPVWVITCDRCGTTYKNNERHACAAREPVKPELDIGYRWVNIGERIIDTDEYLTSYGEWMQTGGLEFKCTVAKKYRRRIEPQAEPSKPERQASEIEKRAAMALVELFKNTIEECVMTRRLESLRGRCTEYIEAYDYAKSIGAIE